MRWLLLASSSSRLVKRGAGRARAAMGQAGCGHVAAKRNKALEEVSRRLSVLYTLLSLIHTYSTLGQFLLWGHQPLSPPYIHVSIHFLVSTDGLHPKSILLIRVATHF